MNFEDEKYHINNKVKSCYINVILRIYDTIS